MPNPFTKYAPTTYVPGYVPAPIEQYATTIGALSTQHRQNIATKNSIDVMAANIDVVPTAQWIKDEAISGINTDLGDILKNGRVQDASYLLPEVYKNRIGANKDLIWAEKQTKKVREAEALRLQYGATGIDFNPAETFSPVEIDPETGEKKYNEYHVDVEPQTNRLGDLANAFDGAQLKGSTSGLEPVKDLPFYRYIQYKGLQPGNYDKFYALAYEAFKETPSYKQMVKERKNPYTSPTGEAMNDADAEMDVMDFVYTSGKRYLGSSSIGYEAMPTTKPTTPGNPLNPYGDGGGQQVPMGDHTVVKVAPKSNKVAVNWRGNVVLEGVRAKSIDILPPDQVSPIDFRKTTVTKEGDYVPTSNAPIILTVGKRLPLEGKEKKTFDKMVEYQLEKNPSLTQTQAKEAAANLWNNGQDVSPAVYYDPYSGKDLINRFLNNGYYFNSKKQGAGASLGNIASMNFYTTTTDDNRISGNKLFTGTGYDVIRPVGVIDINNPENNPWGMSLPILFEATKFDADGGIEKSETYVAEGDINHEANPWSYLKSNVYSGFYREGVPTEIPATDDKAFAIPINGVETRVNAVMFSGEEDGKRTLTLEFFDDDGKQLGKTIKGERQSIKNNITGEDEPVDPATDVYMQFMNTYYPELFKKSTEAE